MKRISIALASFIAVTALFFVASAFTANTEKMDPPVYEHFQYIGSSYDESDFENDANWTSIGTANPGSNPCTDGTTRICVVKVDQSLLSTNPFLTLPEKMELFLVNQGSADTYVNSNYTYRKP